MGLATVRVPVIIPAATLAKGGFRVPRVLPSFSSAPPQRSIDGGRVGVVLFICHWANDTSDDVLGGIGGCDTAKWFDLGGSSVIREIIQHPNPPRSERMRCY